MPQHLCCHGMCKNLKWLDVQNAFSLKCELCAKNHWWNVLLPNWQREAFLTDRNQPWVGEQLSYKTTRDHYYLCWCFRKWENNQHIFRIDFNKIHPKITKLCFQCFTEENNFIYLVNGIAKQWLSNRLLHHHRGFNEWGYKLQIQFLRTCPNGLGFVVFGCGLGPVSI